jgi:hypothetical protein
LFIQDKKLCRKLVFNSFLHLLSEIIINCRAVAGYNKIDCNYVANLLSCAPVKNRPVILRSIAFLLILIFSQKSGAGLFLHNFLHAKNIIAAHPENEDQKSKDMSYACTCIDDFLMPFEETEETVCTEAVLPVTTPLVFFEESIPFHTPIFSSLRGPPACML